MEIFTAVDFSVFGATLLLSASIGIFFALKDRSKATSDHYYFAGRKSNPFAVGMSITATYMSAFAMIAVPAEAYLVGTALISSVITIPLAIMISTIYFVPYFYQLELTSVYQYLEMRFNHSARLMCAISVSLAMMVYAAMAIYLPALAVSAVAPISLTTSIVVTGFVCIFYTTLGGMKAVIWTDTIQAVIMLIGSLAVCVRTWFVVGGLQNMADALERGMRFTASEWNFDVTSRSSTFAIGVFSLFQNTYVLSLTQPSVQRFKSCRTVEHARWAVIISFPPNIAIAALGVLNGMLMYAYFVGCDPIKTGLLQSLDQGMPYVAMIVLRDAPGAAGLFVAAIFCASMSTVSSVINSMSMVILEDLIPLKPTKTSERQKLLIGKFVVALFGSGAIGIAFLFSAVKSNIMRIFVSVMSTLSGPIVGIFVCGLFLPWVNATGIIFGSVTSFLSLTWISVGSIFLKTIFFHAPLPTFFDQCPVDNATAFVDGFNISMPTSTAELMTTTPASAKTYTFDQLAYNLSYYYFSLLGMAATILLAIIVSFITGANSPSKSDPRLFIPLIDSKIFPKAVRRFFRFGVPEKDSFLHTTDNEVDGE